MAVYGTFMSDVYVEPFITSINPDVLNRTIAARSLYWPATPGDKPITPSVFAVDGVASNAAVNQPVCGTKISDCQELELTVQKSGPAVFVRLKFAGVPTPETVAVTV